MNGDSSPARHVAVLLVEDNEDDIELARLAFEQTRLATCWHVAHDGLEGLAFLRREGRYATAPRPDLILLDFNMPRMDGRDMLAIVKQAPELRRIPVIVLTTSDADADVLRAYDTHANAYLTKPVEFSRFVETAKRISDFWFRAVSLPPH